MARKSLRTSGASAPRSSSKRPAPAEAAEDIKEKSKRAKRTSTSKRTPEKSKYFEPDESDDELDEAESLGDQDSADYEESAVEISSDEGTASDFDEEESITTSHQARGSAKKSTAGNNNKKKSELWRPGVKTGLGPGTQIIIKKPKARAAGSTPYTDDTIHPNTMAFLQDLAKNNDRQWLKMHDTDYRTSQKDFNAFLECLTQKVIEIDDTVPELPVKDIVFRIYRDVRFSNNPTPYKTAFSAAWSRTGRKGPYAAYYMQIKPNGESLVAGGLWMPEANALGLLRRDIDRRSHRLKQTLKDPNIRREFLGGVAEVDGKVVEKFAAHNSENALKTKPKGFDSDHKDLELLRLRSFTLSRKLEDLEVLGPRGLERIAELIGCLVPFVTYLNSVVMPDDPSDDEDEDEDDSGDD